MDDFRRAVAILRAAGEHHAATVLERIARDETLAVLLRDSW